MPETPVDEAAADPWLGGRLRLSQPPRGAHRAGTDAVLLGRLVAPGDGALVYDLGAGTGAVGLAVALFAPAARIVLVERDPALAALARGNVALNGMVDRASVVEADVLAAAPERVAAGLRPNVADLVLTNPPYFDAGRHRPSPNPGKASAHAFAPGSLETWVKTGLDLLDAHGILGMIHRADALPDCLDALRRRFGSITVRPVQSRADQPAIRVLITAVKGGRGPFTLRPPLILQQTDGRFTPEAEALHRGAPWP